MSNAPLLVRDYFGQIINTPDVVDLDRRALRLECLKIACTGRGTDNITKVADAMFDFVVEAPKAVPLFIVKRTDVVAENKVALNVAGSWAHWGFERFAYRFRSQTEAEQCMMIHKQGLLGDEDPPWVIVGLPDGYNPF